MQTLLPLAAALLFTAAAPQAGPPDGPMSREYLDRKQEICRDRIHEVRAELGLPRLQRETASPDEPLFIAAVDKRVDGCSVLVMRRDTSDIRPIPKPPEQAPGLIPAQ